MEWVETTGKTVDEAMDRALAHLGVHRDDAEVEVLEEPKSGMFGRVKGEARVRARVRPSGPRPKRSRRSGERTDRPRSSAGRTERPRSEKKQVGEARQGSEVRREKEKAPRATTVTKAHSSVKSPVKEDSMAEGITLAEQGAIAKEFLEGLLASMEIKAEVSIKELDEETVELSVNATPPS
jgi:spoIIIJ-associated protein